MKSESWRVAPLPEAYWFQEGPGVRNTQFTTSGIKLLNVANIDKNGSLQLAKTSRYLSAAEVRQKYTHFLVDDGDLLIASSGISFDRDGLLRTRGVFARESHLPLVMNTSTIRFKAKDGLSDLNFFRHWLQSLEFRRQITQLVTGSAQQNFGPSHLKQINIALPSIDEQRRIAAILDQAEALRAKRRQALAKLDTLTQSLFLEMFGDPRTNPKGWSLEYLENIGEVAGGLQLTPKRKQYNTAQSYLRVANVYRDRLDLSQVKSMGVTPAEFERTRLRKGDLLIVEGHGNPEEIGRCAVWHGQIESCVHQNHLIRVRLNKRVIDPIFVSTYLNSDNGREQVLRAGKTTSGLNTLSTSNVKKFRIYLPPISVQTEFGARVTKFRELVESATEHYSSLENLTASLQHRAFRGEL